MTNNRTVLKLFSGRARWLRLVGNRDKGKESSNENAACYVSVGVSVTTFTSDQRKVFSFVIKINWKLNCSRYYCLMERRNRGG